MIGLIDTTERLGAGQAAYLNFTLLRRCFAGTMSNCSGGVVDGLGIEACAPVTHTDRTTDGMTILDGEYTLVNVTRDDVEANKYPDPFSGQNRGESGNESWGNQINEISGGLVLGGLIVAFLGML